MRILGITGGTGRGKTTALQRIAARQGCVLDCDAVYHELLETSCPMLEAIDRRFPGVVEDGVLQRKKLGQAVFQDPAALEALSALTAPYVVDAVRDRLAQAERDGCPVAAIAAIGLCESGLRDLCDTTVAVLAPPEVRAARLMAREGISREYAEMRIAAQKSNEDFAAMCDHVLMNDCATAEDFGRVCDRFLDEIISE